MTAVDYSTMSGRQIRELCRTGSFDRSTAGVAAGYVQANLVILPANQAADFKRFCELNPRPCPLLESTKPGATETLRLARAADIRTDLPRYRVFEQGRLIDQTGSIMDHWREDFVTFLIGCSFTFESAMLDAGLPVRHIDESRNVPMYRTNIACQSVGPFGGTQIVSMRPMSIEQSETAFQLTSRYPKAHGAPIHVGKPSAIGVACLDEPDYGDHVTIHSNEVPVFWACGVTPMAVLIDAGLPIAITHEPGHMFVTDWLDQDLREEPKDA